MKLFQFKARNRSQRRDRQLLASIHAAHRPLESASEAELAEGYKKLLASYVPEKEIARVFDKYIVNTFALSMEALRRTTGLIAYDVQVLAGIAMARGSIAEMQTGEGKTLTTMFPIAALALSQRGVHVATVNAYLADRDFEFLRPAIEMLGMTAGISRSGASLDEKRAAYACDVTFATGYELGFDFLRDQIAVRTQGGDRLGAKLRRDLFANGENNAPRMQRGFAAAIIDEVDSVFIDEATTPLVLSSGALGAAVDESIYFAAKSAAGQLTEHDDYSIDRSNKTLTLTERGVEASHQIRALFGKCGNAHNLLRPWRQYIESALRAQHLMVRDVNYVVRDEKVEIVDEYTGRIFSDRNWRDGLHQAVEAKECVPITEERRTIARISRQRFFQRYDALCGMTGTADGHQREFQKCYRLPVAIIPRRKQLLRFEIPTRYFRSNMEKMEAIVAESIQRRSTGQPILIGTRTIEQSLQVSLALADKMVEHRVLNGVQDEEEATLIASAGASGTITVATNMAGRGTDIQLDSQAVDAGGLHVIGFERNSSQRIDRQLIGRSGRQGEPGSGQFFVSAEDDLVVRFDASLAHKLGRISKPHGIVSRAFDRRIQTIQASAEKASYQARQEVMREEFWLDKVKKSVG